MMLTQARASSQAPALVEAAPRMRAMDVAQLSAWYGRFQAIRTVTMHIPSQSISAIIGPSGCGKSTLIRCLNRMHEVVPGAHAEGQVLLDGQDIYAPDIDPVLVRRRVGM